MTNIKTTSKTILPLMAALMLNCSCLSDTLSHQYKHVSKQGWSRNDSIVFEFPSANKNGTYSLNTTIRTTGPLPYQKIWLVRNIMLSDPIAAYKDTVCIDISSNGIHSRGNGVTVQSFSHTDTTLVLQEGQKGTIKLTHALPQETLPKLFDIGIRIKLEKESP